MLIRQVLVNSLCRATPFPSSVLGRRFLASEHSSSSSSSSSDSDDDRPKTKKQPASLPKEKTQRLNDLLSNMTTSEKAKPGLEITPKKLKEKRMKMKADNEKVKEAAGESNIEKVAQSVAKVLGGDIKKTESELLMKLLDIKANSAASSDVDGGSLKNVLTGMPIDKGDRTEKFVKTRAQTVKGVLKEQPDAGGENRRFGGQRDQQRDRRQQRKPRAPDSFSSVDIFGGKPLGIFTAPQSGEPSMPSQDNLSLWSELEQRDMKLAITQPPNNYFEKMIQWTEQGKLWRFPISNEQGWEEEAKVSFADHVFLETHLEDWCPTSGPIRHFMELVCVGLSKNYYLSVKEKQNHIAWFREYFEDKKEMLKEIIIQGDENVKKIEGTSPSVGVK